MEKAPSVAPEFEREGIVVPGVLGQKRILAGIGGCPGCAFKMSSPRVPGGAAGISQGVTAEMCRCFVTRWAEFVVTLTGAYWKAQSCFPVKVREGSGLGRSWGKTLLCP